MNPLKELAESILYTFTLPEREAYIDQNQGYITKDESDKRIFKVIVVLHVTLQIMTLFLTIVIAIQHDLVLNIPGKNSKNVFGLIYYFLNQFQPLKKKKRK